MFNPKKETRRTLNREGARAYYLKPLDELFTKVLGSYMAEPKFYEDNNLDVSYLELKDLIGSQGVDDCLYILKIAKLGRKIGMKSYPLAILSICFNLEVFKGSDLLRRYARYIIARPKDVVDLMAMQKIYYPDRPLPMQFKKALRESLERFDTFQLSKALEKGKFVSLADVIKLVRPRAYMRNPHNSDIYKNIIEDKLRFGAEKATLQTVLGGISNVDRFNYEIVLEAIKNSSLGVILKNISSLYYRMAFEQEEIVQEMINILLDEERRKRAKVMPFEYYLALKSTSSVYNETKGLKAVRRALIKALDGISEEKLFQGKTLFMLDLSGSMGSFVSRNSIMTYRDLVCVLGAIAFKQGNDVLMYATYNKYLDGSLRGKSVFEIAQYLSNCSEVGYGTDFKSAIDKVSSSFEAWDRIVVLTDEQSYEFEVETSKYGVKNVSDTIRDLFKQGKTRGFYVNLLCGYGNVRYDPGVNFKLIPGFSEKILNMISIYEELDSRDLKVFIDEFVDRIY